MATVDKIRQLIRDDQVIPVVGAGVAYATAGLPGWKGLVSSGLEYARDKGLDRDHLIERGILLLEEGKLTEAAALVKDLLNAPKHPFSDWLNDLFVESKVRSKELIASIQNLCLPIIATTNYDPLLNEVGLNQNTNIYDWSEYQEIARALRNHQKCILHLHGRFTKPETTIFGADDYSKLSSEHGYKSLLQQLWMDKHFLFIGCSKEGVLDDDFSTVLAFMKEWFPSFPHEHYILMKNDEIAAGSHIRLLTDHNVHAVGFGKTHDVLPLFINSLNPNEDRLVTFRESVANEIYNGLKNILDAKGLTPGSVNSYLKENLGNPYYWIDSSRIKLLEDALRIYNDRILSKKEQFENYQIIIKGLVSVSELEEKIALWKANWNNPSVLNNPEFIELAILAYNSLNRFPKKMLEDIRHRQPYAIHEYYFDNYLGRFIKEYKMFRDSKRIDLKFHYDDDKYFFENLKKIIDSLLGVLALDPNDVFASVEPARIVPLIPFPCLLVRSNESISVREMEPPYREIAFLPGEKYLKNRFCEFVVSKDRRIVVGHDSQKCYYWDAEKDIGSTGFFEASLREAIFNMFNYEEEGALITEVFCGKRIYFFKDFSFQKDVELDVNFSDFIRLAGSKRRFSSYDTTAHKVATCLFEFKEGNEFTPILTNLDLFKFIEEIPIIKEMLNLHLEFEERETAEECFGYPFVGHFSIRSAKWRGEDVVMAKFTLAFWTKSGTVIMTFKPGKQPWKPESIVILPDKLCIAFDLLSSEKGVDMICGYLSCDGNLFDHIEGIDKKRILVADHVPGTFPHDRETHGMQDIYNVCVITSERVLANEESKYLIDIHIPSMKYERTMLGTDICSITYCPI